MKRIKPCFALLLSIVACCCNNPKQQGAPGKKTVEIRSSGNGFTLYRKGQPYVIRGACMLDAAYLRQAKESGANSVRTYNTDHAGAILDSAGKLGMTVTLGLKLPYASIEMNYRDEKAVAREVEKVRKEVLKYKDHPALLMWGVGNELSLYVKTTSVAQYMALIQATGKIARMIHEIDPNHPTTTAIPYVRRNTIAAIDMFCDDLDVLSINSFEELNELPARAKGYNKPYIVSEYGAHGYWLSDQTEWATQIEQTSQQKGAFIIRQSRVLKADTARCLGSYAFIWGHKLEYTQSWFSLFTEPGEATEVIDALQYSWTGKWPAERAPAIYSIAINNRKSNESIYLKPGATFTAAITTGNHDMNGTYLTGQLYKDDLEVAELYSQANYKQEKSRNLIPDSLPLQPGNVQAATRNGQSVYRISLQLQTPAEPGPYRLFLYLHNNRNRVATANACFYVHD